MALGKTRHGMLRNYRAKADFEGEFRDIMGFPAGDLPHPFTDAKRRADTARATFCLNRAQPNPAEPRFC
jgi:hypothetical protein